MARDRDDSPPVSIADILRKFPVAEWPLMTGPQFVEAVVALAESNARIAEANAAQADQIVAAFRPTPTTDSLAPRAD